MLVSATARAFNWNKFDFCWAMFLCRLQKYLGCKQGLRKAVNDQNGSSGISSDLFTTISVECPENLD